MNAAPRHITVFKKVTLYQREMGWHETEMNVPSYLDVYTQRGNFHAFECPTCSELLHYRFDRPDSSGAIYCHFCWTYITPTFKPKPEGEQWLNLWWEIHVEPILKTCMGSMYRARRAYHLCVKPP